MVSGVERWWAVAREGREQEPGTGAAGWEVHGKEACQQTVASWTLLRTWVFPLKVEKLF